MSVLIKGMEMPESCNACRLLEGDGDDGLCHAANRWLDDDEYWLWHQYPEGDVDTSKPSNCPLIEVPPQGKWIKNEGRHGWHCSECMVDDNYAYSWNCETGKDEFQDRYCPHCGAKMEKRSGENG